MSSLGVLWDSFLRKLGLLARRLGMIRYRGPRFYPINSFLPFSFFKLLAVLTHTTGKLITHTTGDLLTTVSELLIVLNLCNLSPLLRLRKIQTGGNWEASLSNKYTRYNKNKSSHQIPPSPTIWKGESSGRNSTAILLLFHRLPIAALCSRSCSPCRGSGMGHVRLVRYSSPSNGTVLHRQMFYLLLYSVRCELLGKVSVLFFIFCYFSFQLLCMWSVGLNFLFPFYDSWLFWHKDVWLIYGNLLVIVCWVP